jgi:hypothetical protein
MRNSVIVATLVVCAACTSDSTPTPPLAPRASATVVRAPLGEDQRVTAATDLARLYAKSKLAAWDVTAVAIGSDCGILFVATPVVMEETMVAAMHYGAGSYRVIEGGIDRYSRQSRFRGVVYRDGSGMVWPYGDASKTEPLTPCR